MQLIFWISLAVIFYTYLGYGIILYALVFTKRLFKKSENNIYDYQDLPETTLIIACYNEADILDEKVQNTLALDYPKDKIQFYFVTDGSNDNSEEVLKKYSEIQVFHEDTRAGKLAAVNRVMNFVNTPLVAFCDANTHLNTDAMVNLMRHYKDDKVGAIAGEKKIQQSTSDSAASSGEGAYWKYESTLKRLDSELYTVVGAAGELFSVRTNLYEPLSSDIIIEDFYLSMRIVQQGFRVVYEPQAYAVETGSASIGEEEKRKVRIAAGGIQSIVKLYALLNIFKYGIVTFQYVSHRVLRWTLTPLLLPVLFVANYFLFVSGHWIYQLFFGAQIFFYLLALGGYIMQRTKTKIQALFIPYYFTFMNWAVYRGFFRYIRGSQSAIWEKSKRA
jgi:cellulose synthase/poly-beta-1,6-N-acetylglucosamine synthase-like glycosyltransferase